MLLNDAPLVQTYNPSAIGTTVIHQLSIRVFPTGTHIYKDRGWQPLAVARFGLIDLNQQRVQAVETQPVEETCLCGWAIHYPGSSMAIESSPARNRYESLASLGYRRR